MSDRRRMWLVVGALVAAVLAVWVWFAWSANQRQANLEACYRAATTQDDLLRCELANRR